MKKMFLFILGLALSAQVAQASIAFATFATEHPINLQIIIDGLVINSNPKSMVKIRGKVGLHHITIKAFDQSGCLVDTYYDSFIIRAGFATEYTVFTDDEGWLKMKEAGYKLIYNERLRRPDWFYNKPNIA